MFIADRTVPAADRAESGTRRRVLTLVSERGPITAAQVAEILGLTTAGVRRHLDVLAEEGAVAESEHTLAEARKRGRPARAYVLTDQGHKNLRGDYDELATSVLRFLRDTIERVSSRPSSPSPPRSPSSAAQHARPAERTAKPPKQNARTRSSRRSTSRDRPREA